MKLARAGGGLDSWDGNSTYKLLSERVCPRCCWVVPIGGSDASVIHEFARALLHSTTVVFYFNEMFTGSGITSPVVKIHPNLHGMEVHKKTAC